MRETKGSATALPAMRSKCRRGIVTISSLFPYFRRRFERRLPGSVS
jgi:hypothetical protein